MERSKSGRRNTTKAQAARLDNESPLQRPSAGRQSEQGGREHSGASTRLKSDRPCPFPQPSRRTSDSQKKMKLSAPRLETTNNPKLDRSLTNTNMAPPTPPDTPTTQQDSTPSGLLVDLPTELLLNVADHLPPDAILALNLTHSRLRAVLPLRRYLSCTTHKDATPAKKKSKNGQNDNNGSIQLHKGRDALLTPCARVNIRTYLSLPSHSRGEMPQRMRCIRCKSTYPLPMFNSSNSPCCIPTSLPQSTSNATPASASLFPGNEQEVVALPSRFCAWHVGSLVRIVRTREDTGLNGWVSSMREMCMHCGDIKGFDRCRGHGAKFLEPKVKENSMGGAKDRAGECESCGTRWVRTYVRYLNNDRECKEYAFWRDRSDSGGEEQDVESWGRGSDASGKSIPDLMDWHHDIQGRLFVREKCWDPEDKEGTKTTISLPVRFEGIATADFTPKPVRAWQCRTDWSSKFGSSDSKDEESKGSGTTKE